MLETYFTNLMPKKRLYRLTEDELDKLVPMNNKVLVKVHDPVLERKSAGGIILIAPTDTDWNPEVHADRYGVVERLPRGLRGGGMWKTNIELGVGDLVWYDYLMGLNSDSIMVGDVEYKLMDYFYLYVAKRGEQIICLNGYCLFEPKRDELKSNYDLVIIHEGDDIRLAKLIYKGGVNALYENDWVDDDGIQEGDVAVFAIPPVMLEAEYYSLFEGKRKYRISQRRYVFGYIRGNDIFPMKDCLIVLPDAPRVFTDGGIIIPESKRRRPDYGTVYKCGDDSLKSGERVHYHFSQATYITHNGVDYGFIRINNLLHGYE